MSRYGDMAIRNYPRWRRFKSSSKSYPYCMLESSIEYSRFATLDSSIWACSFEYLQQH